MCLKKTCVLVLSFLLLYVPVSPVSASSVVAGQTFSAGSARINGAIAPRTTTVFSGDRIVTEKEARTSVSFLGGDAVVIGELSKAALETQDGRMVVRLEAGMISALNKSAKPVVIEAHGARIVAAANQSAAYDVILRGNSLRVIARAGVAHVETANKTADLQPGMELDATMASPDPASLPGGHSDAFTWLLVTAVVAGVTGVVLGAVALHKVDSCHLSPSTTSPSTNVIVC